MKMVPLTYDFSFKRVFELNPKILKQFLFEVLDLERIVDPKKCKMKINPNELTKTNSNEYQKTLDVYVVLNKNIHIDIEMNSKYFEDIKLRNLMYVDKANSLLLEKGDEYKLLDEKFLYQLNLNAMEKQVVFGEDVIVPYGINTGKIYNENKKVVVKFLAYYRYLFYNKGTKEKSDIWLAMLTAEDFTELYDILDEILTPNERNKFIRDVVMMSKDNFILHEWEKEKLDALVENQMKKNSFNAGKEEGLEQGLVQGSKEKQREIAKNMIKEDVDIDFVIKVTGLSETELEELK